MFIQTGPVEDTLSYTFSYTPHLCYDCEEEMYYILDLDDKLMFHTDTMYWICFSCGRRENIEKRR